MSAKVQNLKLRNSMEWLQNQKHQAIQEIAEVGTQITAILLDGQDVSHLLGVKLQREKFIEAIDLAMTEAERQINELKPQLLRENLAQMEADLEGLYKKHGEVKRRFREEAGLTGHQVSLGFNINELIKRNPEKGLRVRELQNESTKLQVEIKKLSTEIDQMKRRSAINH